MFKLVRMEKIERLKKKSSKDHSQKDVVVHNDPNVLTITLFGLAKMKSKCKEYLNGEVVKEYETGDFEFRFTVPEKESYWYGVILSFGANVKILSPQSVIDRILTTCSEVTKNYKE